MQHADPDYTTNIALDDLVDDDVLLALKHNGRDLEPDHGGPDAPGRAQALLLEERQVAPRPSSSSTSTRPGFWEQNGYHMHADPWTEERYSDQETRAMQQMRAEAARKLRAR